MNTKYVCYGASLSHTKRFDRCQRLIFLKPSVTEHTRTIHVFHSFQALCSKKDTYTLPGVLIQIQSDVTNGEELARGGSVTNIATRLDYRAEQCSMK